MLDRPGEPTAGTARAVVLMAVAAGLVAGLLEVAVLVAQDAIDPRVTVETIRTNHHYPWMIPASAAAIFAVAGLALGVVAIRWPGPASRAAPWLLGVPMFLAPLLAVRGLYPIVCVLLAGGLAARLAPWARPDGPRFRRWIRVGVPILFAVVVVLGWARWSKLESRGRRLSPPPIEAEGGARPTSVLLVVMDTVRADHLGLYGYGRPTTPNLDRWARKGVVFTGARSTAPWTLPSHASMLTGRWPHELSADVDHPLDDVFTTLAEFLAGRGHAAGGFVANTYYCNAWYGLDRGFDRYEDFPENLQVSAAEVFRSSMFGSKLARKAGLAQATPGEKGSRKTAAMVNRDALAWISTQAGRPFFAFLNYYDAHGPFEPPDGHRWRFGPGATDPAARVSTFKQLHDIRAKDAPGGGDGDAPRNAAGPVKPGVGKPLDLLLDGYDECIASIDEQLGALLDELDRRGILDRTLVIVTSDHGEHFGDRGLFGHGSSLYRPLIDVPLLIVPPSGDRLRVGAEGLRVAEPVSLRDLPATVADVLGLGAQSPFPGRSLAPLWGVGSAPALASAEPPLSEVEHQKKFPPSPHVPASNGPLWSLIDGTLVFIRNSQGREQLFDRSTDPDEAVDLAGRPDRKADVARLRVALDRMLREDGTKMTAREAIRAR